MQHARLPQRLWRHVVCDQRSARRAFPPAVRAAIEAAIAEGEARHRGQVCFVVEAALPLARVVAGLRPRERALEVFGLMRVWDTEDNAGVLVYLLLADRDVEIVADRGIHRAASGSEWEAICRKMEAAFRARRYEYGAVAGIREINVLLERHFPRDGAGPVNELSDRPVVM